MVKQEIMDTVNRGSISDIYLPQCLRVMLRIDERKTSDAKESLGAISAAPCTLNVVPEPALAFKNAPERLPDQVTLPIARPNRGLSTFS
jgi:hypothetical protein